MLLNRKLGLMIIALILLLTTIIIGATLPNQKMIVIFKGDITHSVKDRIGDEIALSWDNDLPLINGRVAHVSLSQLKKLKARQEVELVCEDTSVGIMKKVMKPGDTQPVESVPWGITAIHADNIIYKGNDIKVGILDTGIDTSHPDLSGRVIGGKNFTSSKKSYLDDNGHGTHVAGIIAAVHNQIGVVGVSPMVQLYSLKVLDSTGNGNISNIVAGLQWAVQNGLDIVNMSIGTDIDNPAFKLAIDNAAKAGLIMVAAAGNDGSDVDYPAAYDRVICVSAVDINSRIADFSSHGSQVDISAPGVEILSTIPGGKYAYDSGTSMATPHVTASLALLIQVYKDKGIPYEYNDLFTRIKSNASFLGDTNYYGAGLIDIEKSVGSVN